MNNIGIFYGSTTGNTESAAGLIQRLLGSDAKVFDVTLATSLDIESCNYLIFGVSTWGVGDLQDDFDTFMEEIEKANLSGKKVAIFGYGDQEAYSDSFVDALGKVYKVLLDKECKIVGSTCIEGYNYDSSKAEINGQFVGLVLDDDNQGQLTEKRITSWVQQLEDEFK